MNLVEQPRESSLSSRVRNWLTLGLAVLILVPSLLGFGTKFLEFIQVYNGDVDGMFAIGPILNYLLASGGFLLLLVWATLDGMFHDIEQPKYDLLTREEWLDAN
jgi:hypothetical protein